MALEVRIAKRIIRCSRCGKNHRELKAKKLTHPVRCPHRLTPLYTHWATCPTNKQPLLVRFDT
jgi:hypothetical protein